MSNDPFDLGRFVLAQAPIFQTAMRELRAGAKRTHWMWFVFPQLRGLGVSSTAQFYGLRSLDEARAYLAHSTLGPRLLESVDAATQNGARDLRALFGSPDGLKFCSSMTLFAAAAPDGPFQQALERWPDGRTDARTRSLLDGLAKAASTLLRGESW